MARPRPTSKKWAVCVNSLCYHRQPCDQRQRETRIWCPQTAEHRKRSGSASRHLPTSKGAKMVQDWQLFYQSLVDHGAADNKLCGLINTALRAAIKRQIGPPLPYGTRYCRQVRDVIEQSERQHRKKRCRNTGDPLVRDGETKC